MKRYQLFWMVIMEFEIMKIRRLFYLLLTLLFTSISLSSQTRIIEELYNDYYIVHDGEKFGFSKDTNQVDYLYDTIVPSRGQEYFYIKNKGKWGVLNGSMKTQIKCIYDWIEVACCYENVTSGKDNFIVKSNCKYGLINHYGKQIIPLIYDGITSWVEYGPNAHYVIKDDKIGLINHGGKIMIPAIYDSLYYNNSNGLIKAKFEDKFGVLNSNHEIVIPFEYQALILDFKTIFDSDDHLDKFVVMKNGLWHYLNESGRPIRSNMRYQEIKDSYFPFELTNYDFEYVGALFIR